MEIFFLIFFAVCFIAAIIWASYKRKHDMPLFLVDHFNVWWNGIFFAHVLYSIWFAGG